MSLQSKTNVNLSLEAHTVAALEDYAPNAANLNDAIMQALSEFFSQRNQKPQA